MNQFMDRLTLHDSRFKGFSGADGGVYQQPARNRSLPDDSHPPQRHHLLIVGLVDSRRDRLRRGRIVRPIALLSKRWSRTDPPSALLAGYLFRPSHPPSAHMNVINCFSSVTSPSQINRVLDDTPGTTYKRGERNFGLGPQLTADCLGGSEC